MEYFLAEDILQGEDVPFYLLWDEDNPKEIILDIEGFESIKELHNVAEFTNEGNKVIITKLFIKGYLGGLLSTKITEDPIVIGKINIEFVPFSGKPIQFGETRKLYTTSVKIINKPETIHITPTNPPDKMILYLKGKTTIFFQVEELPENECKIDLPPDLKETIQKIQEDIKIGFKEIEEKFPTHRETLEIILELDDKKQSPETLAEDILERIEKSFEDQEFSENVLMVFFTAVTKQLESRKNLMNSLQEYFESFTSLKAYFVNPMLNVYVNKCESCCFAIRIHSFDLNKGECGNPIEIKITIQPEVDFQSPIKELFIIEREDHD